MSAQVRSRPRVAGISAAFPALAVGLTLAAAVELLVLRSFTRTAIHIPALESFAGPYRVISSVGRFDYYLAAVLLVLALPVAAVALGAVAGRPGVLAAAGVGVFAVAATMTRLDALDEILLAVATCVAVATVACALVLIDVRAGALAALYAAAFALSAGSAILQAAGQYGLPRTDVRSLLWLAEALAVACALASAWALGIKRTRSATIAGAAAALLTFALLLGGAATTKILMLWNIGLSGVLPSVLYAAAGGVLVVTVVALARQGRGLAAAGVTLVAIGGIGLHSTYQSGLVVVGLAALCIAAAAARSAPHPEQV